MYELLNITKLATVEKKKNKTKKRDEKIESTSN